MKRFIIFLTLIVSSSATFAHQFLPTDATLSVLSDTEFGMVIEVDVIEIVQTVNELEGEGDELINTVRNMPFPEVTAAFDRALEQLKNEIIVYFDGTPLKLDQLMITSRQQVLMNLRRRDVNIEHRMQLLSESTYPQGADKVQVKFPEYLGPVNLIVNSPRFLLVSEGEMSEPYLINTDAMQAGMSVSQIVTYFYQGVIHIIPQGLDHILFVIALFLLSTRISSLLWQVTAFTVAHTITFIMASYGIVSLPASIVEPLIAFSIVFVAAENLYHSQLQAWRMLLVFIFGLLHGLGFASVLMGFGLPESQLFASLVSFNIGVEIGQLLVILGCFLVVGWFRQKPWYRSAIILPGSVMIALTGLYWTVTRVIELM